MNRPTKSELLFRTYCAEQSYRVERIPEDSDKTSDFLVSTPHGQLIAEIKELRPNQEDARIVAEEGGTINRIPGKRVQKQLDRSKNQTERYAARQIPCVVVLYDNVVVDGIRPFYPNYYLSSTDLVFGMYGEMKTTIFFDKAAGKIIETRGEYGKNQSLTAERRQEISAVCVLSEVLENINDRHFKNPVNGNTFVADWILF